MHSLAHLINFRLKVWYWFCIQGCRLKLCKLNEFHTYHRQHLHETKQIDEHHTRRGNAELHLEKGHGTLAIAPDVQQNEKGRAALQQAAGAADDHKDWTLRGMRVRRLEVSQKKENHLKFVVN